MKKITLFALIISLIACITSCTLEQVVGNGNSITKSIEVGEFDKIQSSGSFDVQLIKGEEGKIEVSIEENLLEYLEIEVVNGTLKVKWRNGTSVKSNTAVIVTVPFTAIEKVSLTGSGEINCTDTIKAQKFETRVSGSGDINLNLIAEKTTSKITGSGEVKLNGFTNILESKITGSGIFRGSNLKSKQVSAKVTGSGDTYIGLTDYINAKITGSGNIIHKKATKDVDAKITGSGGVSIED